MTRSALVTGASRGIGLGVARSLARQGLGLTITSRSEADLTLVAEELRALGSPNVAAIAADMADRDTLPEVVERHRQTFGVMDALVVNAGVGTAGPVADLELRRFDKTIAVNLTAAVVLVQASLPHLRAAAAQRQQGARVVALSSITGVYAEPGLAAYGASKAALLSFIDTVNAEESGSGVAATAIAPGYVETDMSAWTTDTVPASSMIHVSDVVSVVDMVLRLGRTACIPRVVMTRAGTSGYDA